MLNGFDGIDEGMYLVMIAADKVYKYKDSVKNWYIQLTAYTSKTNEIQKRWDGM